MLRRLAGNDELRIALSRYAIIGECLRSAPGRSVTRGFAARVSAAVAAEGRWQGRRSIARFHALAAAAWRSGHCGHRRDCGDSRSAAHPAEWSARRGAGRSELSADDFDWWAGDRRGGELHRSGSHTGGPVIPAGRLTSYVVAHSEYSTPLGRRNVLSGLVAEDPTPMDEPPAAPGDSNEPALIHARAPRYWLPAAVFLECRLGRR